MLILPLLHKRDNHFVHASQQLAGSPPLLVGRLGAHEAQFKLHLNTQFLYNLSKIIPLPALHPNSDI